MHHIHAISVMGASELPRIRIIPSAVIPTFFKQYLIPYYVDKMSFFNLGVCGLEKINRPAEP
jgi:hypothetical protein